MSKRNNRILLSAGGLLALTLAGLLTSQKVSAAIRAAFVEVVIPSSPFYGRMFLNSQNSMASIGPDTGTLGVTNITVTNYSSSISHVLINAPTFAGGGGCGSSQNGFTVGLDILVQPLSTMTISYPTPLVWGPIQGHSCIGAQYLGPESVDVNLTGFVN